MTGSLPPAVADGGQTRRGHFERERGDVLVADGVGRDVAAVVRRTRDRAGNRLARDEQPTGALTRSKMVPRFTANALGLRWPTKSLPGVPQPGIVDGRRCACARVVRRTSFPGMVFDADVVERLGEGGRPAVHVGDGRDSLPVRRFPRTTFDRVRLALALEAPWDASVKPTVSAGRSVPALMRGIATGAPPSVQRTEATVRQRSTAPRPCRSAACSGSGTERSGLRLTITRCCRQWIS